MSVKKILVTGGAGYIGSHTVVELLQSGYEVVVFDNLSNSSPESLRRVSVITGKYIEFVQGDIRDRDQLKHLFSTNCFDAVLHFAGLKAVGESVDVPLTYYENNVAGTVALCQAMTAAKVFRIVFSSSATVYGTPLHLPLKENSPLGIQTNPYGRSKLMVEEVLSDLVRSDKRWSVALLRYFNPVGAHTSGLIGEDPMGTPNNLLPFITQVAVGHLPELQIFGDDYPTNDGTGVRDYIHVVDLARGHLKALEYICEKNGVSIWNLGTGRGYSVKEVIHAFEAMAGISIPFKIAPRRKGDIAECWSDASKSESELGWKAEKGIEEMVSDAWHWQLKNPFGYRNNS